MPAITVELDDNMAEVLRRLAADQRRSETEIVREALSAHVKTARPLPRILGSRLMPNHRHFVQWALR